MLDQNPTTGHPVALLPCSLAALVQSRCPTDFATQKPTAVFSPEKLGVATHPDKDQLRISGLVDEQQIPRQVTFPKTLPVSNQRMIAEMDGQGVVLLEHSDRFGEPFQIAPCPCDSLKVLLELLFVDDLAHVRS